NYGATYATPRYHGYALKISNGNYTGLSIAAEIQEKLQTSIPDKELTCSYNITTGKLTIKGGTDELFKVLSDEQVICMPYKLVLLIQNCQNHGWDGRIIMISLYQLMLVIYNL
uniref:hypothetical protein n=1 Tax=Flavobacterium sp. TaxID=239 RepID=UPI004048F4C3